MNQEVTKKGLEARVGIEPTNKGFADPSRTPADPSTVDTFSATAFNSNGNLTAVVCGPEWFPIATAPKDGKQVILWGPTDLLSDGRMNWRMTISSFYESSGRWKDWGVFAGGYEPTHWMPLPARPEAELCR